MTSDFSFNWNNILNVLKTFSINDFVDIVIVAFLVYKVLNFASNNRAGRLLKGIFFLLVLYFFASEFTLKSTSYLLEQVFSFGMIAIIVVFQPELRHALESMGKSKISNLNFFNFNSERLDDEAVMRDCITKRNQARRYNFHRYGYKRRPQQGDNRQYILPQCASARRRDHNSRWKNLCGGLLFAPVGEL